MCDIDNSAVHPCCDSADPYEFCSKWSYYFRNYGFKINDDAKDVMNRMPYHKTVNDKPVVLIDIDDTIANLLSAWCIYLNTKYETYVLPSNIREWDMQKAFPTLTKEQIYEPINNDDFWKTVQPKQDAMEYVKKLYDDGYYEIYLCTSTDYRNVKVKYECIVKRYFPYIQWNHVIVASNKQMIRADYLIDDGVHNLENGNFVRILMTAPHNMDYDAEANGMYRVSHWKEVYDIINGR